MRADTSDFNSCFYPGSVARLIRSLTRAFAGRKCSGLFFATSDRCFYLRRLTRAISILLIADRHCAFRLNHSARKMFEVSILKAAPLLEILLGDPQLLRVISRAHVREGSPLRFAFLNTDNIRVASAHHGIKALALYSFYLPSALYPNRILRRNDTPRTRGIFAHGKHVAATAVIFGTLSSDRSSAATSALERY